MKKKQIVLLLILCVLSKTISSQVFLPANFKSTFKTSLEVKNTKTEANSNNQFGISDTIQNCDSCLNLLLKCISQKELKLQEDPKKQSAGKDTQNRDTLTGAIYSTTGLTGKIDSALAKSANISLLLKYGKNRFLFSVNGSAKTDTIESLKAPSGDILLFPSSERGGVGLSYGFKINNIKDSLFMKENKFATYEFGFYLAMNYQHRTFFRDNSKYNINTTLWQGKLQYNLSVPLTNPRIELGLHCALGYQFTDILGSTSNNYRLLYKEQSVHFHDNSLPNIFGGPCAELEISLGKIGLFWKYTHLQSLDMKGQFHDVTEGQSSIGIRIFASQLDF